jgi:hypothetical protein
MDPLTSAWLEALERRHLADLTVSEVSRALRALSSCYVERRDKLVSGGPLSSAGKRAAFALFYGPQHFVILQKIVNAMKEAGAFQDKVPGALIDLGCGTGAAGAAWAISAGIPSIQGFDRNQWAIDEATWTYRSLQLRGRAARKDIGSANALAADQDARRVRGGRAVLAAYAANELPPAGRAALLASLLDAHRAGDSVLVVEPIARRSLPWWSEWQSAFVSAGGRADEWRFPADLPQITRTLARAAGLDPRELTARSLFL